MSQPVKCPMCGELAACTMTSFGMPVIGCPCVGNRTWLVPTVEQPPLDLTMEIVVAQRDALADACAALVKLIHNVGGYLTVEHQIDVRHAEALLVEVTR